MAVKVLYSLVYCLTSIGYGLTTAGTGALIPIKAREMHKEETDFAQTLFFRGVGGVIGAAIGLGVESFLTMNKTMAIACFLMASASFAAAFSRQVWLFSLSFCIMQMCGILCNACSVVTLVRLHSNPSHSQAWTKGIYLCFAIGAFTTPVVINFMGQKAYDFYPFVCIVVGLFLLFMRQPEKTIEEATENEQNKENPHLRFHIMLIIFLLIYSGGEASYSGWISSFGTIGNRVPMDKALYAMSVFWISKSIGRALCIPLSFVASTKLQLFCLTIALILSTIVCNILDLFHYYQTVIFLGSVTMGLFMSGIYPLVLNLPHSYKIPLNSKAASAYMLGGCIGFGVIPYITGQLIAHFGPDMLFISQTGTATLMLILLIVIVRMPKNLPAFSQRSQLTQQ